MCNKSKNILLKENTWTKSWSKAEPNDLFYSLSILSSCLEKYIVWGSARKTKFYVNYFL